MDLFNATTWMQENLDMYDSPFDLAVDCCQALNLNAGEKEIVGASLIEGNWIPDWMMELAETFFSSGN